MVWYSSRTHAVCLNSVIGSTKRGGQANTGRMQQYEDNRLCYRYNSRIGSTERSVVMKKSLICNHKAVGPLNCYATVRS